jgi:hypothetical protein
MLIAMLYLQISPTSSQFADSLPDLRNIGANYVQIQFYLLILFLIPFILLYSVFSQINLGNLGSKTNRVSVFRAEILSVGMLVFCLFYSFFLLRNNMLFNRIGSEFLAEKIVNLATLDFAVIRLYQDTALFIVSMLYFIWRSLERSKAKYIVGFALIINLLMWGLYVTLNSRLMVLTGAVCFLGYWLILGNLRKHQFRVLIRILGFSLVAFYLATIAINVRTLGFDGQIRADYLVPQFNLFGDSQGFDRLNCVDLIARLQPEIGRQGPAWGQAWQSVYWNINRYLDPAGFDQFRLSLNTTAKTYLMRRYLGWDRPDYYSCTLTDLYGNFDILGFAFGAVLFALLLSLLPRLLRGELGGLGTMLGLYLATSILVFDQEASSLLFNWTKHLPLLAVMFFLNPFGRVRNRQVPGKELFV